MEMTRLNKHFGIAESVKFIAHGNNLPFISVNNRSASALISLYGGQVLSFKRQGERDDLLFLSAQADYSGERAIRGGIPVCWPWFGPDPEALQRPNHGFARNALWELAKTEICSDYETRLQLRLLQSDAIRAMCPYRFDLILEIRVADSLTLELVTHNYSGEAFLMTQALHTYFRVGDIGQILVLGLENRNYLDKLDHGRRKKQTGVLGITEAVDRIYTGMQHPLLIEDRIMHRRIRIAAEGLHSAVIWNPWSEASAELCDLAADDYKGFLCVETGHVAADAIIVAANSESRLRADYSILPYPR